MEAKNNFTTQFVDSVKSSFGFVRECIYPKEAYARGYADAVADATHEGEPIGKNTRIEIGLKYAFSISDRSREHFWKSYHEGYNVGYTDGLRKRHQVFESKPAENVEKAESFSLSPPKISQTTGMSENKASLERQRNLTQELIDRLHRLNQNLDKVQKAYARKIGELEQAGLMSNYVTRFQEDKHEEVRAKIATIAQQIEGNDIRYLEIIRDKIQNGIDKI
jgi:hypothetical protein